MKKTFPSFLFVILLIIISFFYKYQEIVFKKPQSIHKWRQSDCASIALNYYQDGMHFFHPETNNLTSDGGTTGKCCTSEIPILYYSVACLYKIFGHHDYIYRIFNTLIFFTGLFFLYRLLQYVLKDTFWAISITLLFFTSPVLVFYGNNFLTNSSALAFSIIAWYFFIRFLFESIPKWFYISIVCFFLAAAFKVTALFSLIAITCICLLELFNLNEFKENTKLFKQPVRFITPILLIFIVIGLWLKYANYYNHKHDCSYFSTTIFPIWDLTKEEIKEIATHIKDAWLDQYFHKSVLLFIICSFIFVIFSFKKNNKFLLFGILFIFIEAIVYILFQFWTFSDHDYYTIEMYILPVLIIISAFDVLKRHYFKFFNSLISKIVFLFFLLFNIYYAQAKMNERYNSWMNDYPQNKDLYSITPYLRQIGLTPNDTIISIPDGSHASLYLMNQKGWTEYIDAHFNKGTPTPYNHDSIGIQASINKGAKYLVINGIGELYKKPYLQYYCKNLIGRYNNVLIFQLKTNVANFNAHQNKIKDKFTCNAESVTKDKQYFINEAENTLFEFGVTQSDEYAHSGKYSCKLDAAKQYGMTIRCKDLKYGESFSICVWRKAGNKAKGGLIASAKDYYNNEYKVIETDSNGWERICKKLFISSELVNMELTIYLYNPEKEPVYFDDLEIIRYEGVSINNKDDR
jgi:hypothetical protein